jgi:hypothetical protein
MGVSVDGFIVDREVRSGGRSLTRSSFASTLRRHVSSAAICAAAGSKETMPPWETDPSMRDNELAAR